MTLFADTFALIAWLNPQDNAHALVTSYLDGFTGRLVTTEWVLVELADALSAPMARSAAVAFLQAVRADPMFEIVGFDPAVYRAGFDLFAARPDKAWSLTEALTADHHFEQAGFRAVFK